MTALFVFAAVHVLVPVALLVWQWRAQVSSRVQWLARTIAFGTFFVALHFAGFWIVLPRWISYAYLGALALVSAASFVRVRQLPLWAASNRRSVADVAVHLVFSLIFSATIVIAVMGYRAPTAAFAELAFPLRGGTYAIGSGGGSGLLNFHLKTLADPAYRSVRGQAYAVDVVKLNRFGARSTGFAPSDPAAYAIFGETLYSPCDGTVAKAKDGLPDHNPPARDPKNLAGNFVFLQCGEFQVLLAHMKHGSVKVREGDRVATGQALGEVGNSGNTTEPHLHLHAQRAGSAEFFLDGEPLPMMVDGRFLVRNDRILAN
jgi:hypothetical protein